MTGKRFTYDEFEDCIIDNVTGKTYWGLDDILNNKLNELHEENQIKLEIIDSFIRGLEDEKGIDPENKEFQCRMNFTIKVLKKLKKDMLEPTEFKRLKELIE